MATLMLHIRKYAMIHISEEQVEKYRELYLLDYGKPIDAIQARIELTALVSLLDAMHQHMENYGWPDVSNV